IFEGEYARGVPGARVIGVNMLCAITDYGRVVSDSIEAGVTEVTVRNRYKELVQRLNIPLPAQ
ncbi:MAG TPA: transcription initiation factor IIB, partial [Pyrodictium sp.]|nr:transcription initiation factor IIB [Pyrodictium sp.]